MPKTYITKNGGRVELGEYLKMGGEAFVYAVDDTTVAKIYKKPQTELKEQKLKAMVDNPPPTADKAGTLALAWPTKLLYSEDSALAGFTMPRIPEEAKELFFYTSPKRLKGILAEEGWEKESFQAVIDQKVTYIGQNLVTIVGSLHGLNYIICDINEQNIKVDKHCNVVILDTDSFQIHDHRRGVTYRATVGTSDYTDPNISERVDRSTQGCTDQDCTSGPEWHKLTYGCFHRTVEHDNFAIAVILFKLLINGCHPFSKIGEHNEHADLIDRMKKKQFLFGESLDKCPKHARPRWGQLNSRWQKYFVDTFTSDTRYKASEVRQLFYDYPPLTRENLGEQRYFEMPSLGAVGKPPSQQSATSPPAQTNARGHHASAPARFARAAGKQPPAPNPSSTPASKQPPAPARFARAASKQPPAPNPSSTPASKQPPAPARFARAASKQPPAPNPFSTNQIANSPALRGKNVTGMTAEEVREICEGPALRGKNVTGMTPIILPDGRRGYHVTYTEPTPASKQPPAPNRSAKPASNRTTSHRQPVAQHHNTGIRCPKCSVLNRPDRIRCENPKCHADLAPPKSCRKCGSSIPGKAKFCTKCRQPQ
jgi:serine/threonine protein kinase